MTTSNIVVTSASQGQSTPTGSLRFSVNELIELSLQQIGAYTPNDEGADPVEVERSQKWLEMIVAEVAGTEDCWWLVPESILFNWPQGERMLTLEDAMGSNFPSTGVLFPISATLRDSDGARKAELELVRRWQYEEIHDKSDAGQPELMFIDRRAADGIKAYIYRVPDSSAYYVDMTVQTYHRSLLGSQGNSDQAGSIGHGFSQEWQLFLVNKLSSVIGNGPVRRLPRADVEKYESAADESFAKLVHSNREKKSEPSRTAPWGRD